MYLLLFNILKEKRAALGNTMAKAGSGAKISTSVLTLFTIMTRTPQNSDNP
jgi:hypothetical protein